MSRSLRPARRSWSSAAPSKRPQRALPQEVPIEDARCGACQSRACATCKSMLPAWAAITTSSAYARALAALALHHLVALLEQAFAFAVFAFLLLLDIRAFFTGHGWLLPREGGRAPCIGY